MLPTTSCFSGRRAIPEPLSASPDRFRQDLRHAVHVRLSLLERHAGLEPAHRVHAHSGAAIAKCGIVPLADGHIDVAGMEIAAIVVEIGGSHAYHGIADSVERQRFSEHVRCGAEFRFQNPPLMSATGWAPTWSSSGLKQAARHGIHAEYGEEIRGNHFRCHALGLAHAGQVEIILAERRDCGKRTLAAQPVEKIRIRDGGVRKLFGFRIDGHEAIRLI